MSDFINLEKIAERLIQIQTESGLNAKEFCDETDISSSTYSQIKNGLGKVSVDIINKVVQRWGTRFSPQWFLFGETSNTEATLFGEEAFESDNSESERKLFQSLEEIGRLKAMIEQQRPREIERITVFYTDKSVAHYILES